MFRLELFVDVLVSEYDWRVDPLAAELGRHHDTLSSFEDVASIRKYCYDLCHRTDTETSTPIVAIGIVASPSLRLKRSRDQDHEIRSTSQIRRVLVELLRT